MNNWYILVNNLVKPQIYLIHFYGWMRIYRNINHLTCLQTLQTVFTPYDKNTFNSEHACENIIKMASSGHVQSYECLIYQSGTQWNLQTCSNACTIVIQACIICDNKQLVKPLYNKKELLFSCQQYNNSLSDASMKSCNTKV